MTTFDYTGQVVIVTGGGRGIGRSHSLMFAERGASVVVNDVGVASDGSGGDTSVAQAVVDEILARGGRATASTDSVSTTEGAEAIVRTAIDAFGRLDAVVSNAGLVSQTAFPEVTLDELDRLLRVDPMGPFNVSRAAWPHFQAQGGGRIVMTTSAAAFGSDANPAYGTAKMATWSLARALAATGRPLGIKVNAISPFGYSRMSFEGGLSTAQIQARERLAPPEAVSAMALRLAHPSVPVTGELLAAGAGRIQRIFLAQAAGIFEGELTPEAVERRWDEIFSDDVDEIIVDSLDYITRFYEAVPGWGEAMAAAAAAGQ